MQLTFINGSPRGKKSNTTRLMDHFIRGFLETNGNTSETMYLTQHKHDLPTIRKTFADGQNVIIGFPLYVDAMPGSVKEFLEALASLEGEKGNPALGFVIQCGFPETSHNHFVARYCEKFCRRLGCSSLGSILKGGCEGLNVQPNFLTDKYYALFYMLGLEFGKTGKFDPTLLEKLARPEHLKAENMAQVIPFINQGLWDVQLEANGVLEKSFDQPLS